MSKVKHGLTAAFACLALGSALAAQPSSYRVKLIDAVPSTEFTAAGFYGHQKFLGWAGPVDTPRAAIKRPAHAARLLPRLPGTDACYATASDAAGTIYGSCGLQGRRDGYLAFRWTQVDGTVQIPMNPPAASSAFLQQSNANGLVVGYAEYYDKSQDLVTATTAIYIDDSGLMHVLPKTAAYAQAFGVNEQGVIVGLDANPDFSNEAAVWRNGALERLPRPKGAFGAYAVRINEELQVLGRYADADSSSHPIWWSLVDKSFKLIKVPDIARDHYAMASGFLPNGDVLVNSYGNLSDPKRVNRAYIWRSNSDSQDLDSMVNPADPYHGRVHIMIAHEANKRGEIRAFGQIDGDYQEFVLVPW